MNIDTESKMKFNIDFKLKDISFINEITIQLKNETERVSATRKKHSRTSHVFCFYLNLNRLLLTFYNRLKMKGKIYKNEKVKGFTSEER